MPVDLADPGSVWRFYDEPLIGFVGVQLGVETDPDLGSRLANGGDQYVPRALSDDLRFLDPANVHTLKGLKVRHRLLPYARKSEV